MGGAGFEVETADLALLAQVFGRQQQHMTTIKTYVSDNCSASGAFTGLMSLLQGKYSPAHQTAVTGFGQGADIALACQTKITQTRTDLIETDRKQYEKMRALHPGMPPYEPPPGGGALPPAGEKVPAATDDQGLVKKFILESGEVAKRPFDSAAAVTDYDPTDPRGHAPAEAPGPDDATSHSYWVNKGIDNVYQRAVDSYYDHKASGLPSGASGSDLQEGAARDIQIRYENSYGQGAQFATDHTGITGQSTSHMPGTAYPSDSLRTGAHSVADNAGKIVNIVQAPVNFTDSAQRFGDSVQLNNDINDAADGPSNTGDRDWAQSGGDDW